MPKSTHEELLAMGWMEGKVSPTIIRMNENYPCKIPNCANKKRNGRCRLSTIRNHIMHSYDTGKHYYKCKDF